MTTTPKDSREAFEEQYSETPEYSSELCSYVLVNIQYDYQIFCDGYQAATDRLLAMLDDEGVIEAVRVAMLEVQGINPKVWITLSTLKAKLGQHE